MDYKWTIVRLFKRAYENGKEFLEDFTHDVWEVIKLPYQIMKDFAFFFERLLDYVPYIWNDRDFDWNPILRMLQYKIKRTADHIEEHQLHTNWKRDVTSMRKCISLIDRILEDDYDKEPREQFKLKYGRHIWYTECKILSDDNPHNYTTTISKYERENDSNKEQIRKEYLAMIGKADKERNQDWETLCKTLNKDMQNWWD